MDGGSRAYEKRNLQGSHRRSTYEGPSQRMRIAGSRNLQLRFSMGEKSPCPVRPRGNGPCVHVSMKWAPVRNVTPSDRLDRLPIHYPDSRHQSGSDLSNFGQCRTAEAARLLAAKRNQQLTLQIPNLAEWVAEREWSCSTTLARAYSNPISTIPRSTLCTRTSVSTPARHRNTSS